MRRLALSLTVGLLCLCLVAPAHATPVAVNDIITVKDWGPGGGGEILYYNYSTQQYFSTFCLEKEVYIYPGYDYQVTNISNTVISGGTGSKILVGETKWLFYQWAMGTLEKYSLYGEGSLHWQYGFIRAKFPKRK